MENAISARLSAVMVTMTSCNEAAEITHRCNLQTGVPVLRRGYHVDIAQASSAQAPRLKNKGADAAIQRTMAIPQI